MISVPTRDVGLLLRADLRFCDMINEERRENKVVFSFSPCDLIDNVSCRLLQVVPVMKPPDRFRGETSELTVVI